MTLHADRLHGTPCGLRKDLPALNMTSPAERSSMRRPRRHGQERRCLKQDYDTAIQKARQNGTKREGPCERLASGSTFYVFTFYGLRRDPGTKAERSEVPTASGDKGTRGRRDRGTKGLREEATKSERQRRSRRSGGTDTDEKRDMRRAGGCRTFCERAPICKSPMCRSLPS